jgi:hypothetical protein
MRVYGTEVNSRLLLGTAQYPSPKVLADAISASGCEIITVSLRRETADGSGAGFWDLLRDTGSGGTSAKRRRVAIGHGSYICSPAGFGQKSRCYSN